MTINQTSFWVSTFNVLGLNYIAIPGIENDCLSIYCQDDLKFTALAAFEESAILSWVEWNDGEYDHPKVALLEHLNSHDMFAAKEPK